MSGTYNGAEQLTSYSNAAADMTAATYDGDGLRTSAASTPTGGSSSTQNFVWDTTSSVPRLLMDSTNAYIYGPSGTPFEQVNLSTGAITYLVADALGSVRGVVSSTGSLSASTSYDAWGNPETTGGLTCRHAVRLRRRLHRPERIGLPHRALLRPGDRAVPDRRSAGRSRPGSPMPTQGTTR